MSRSWSYSVESVGPVSPSEIWAIAVMNISAIATAITQASIATTVAKTPIAVLMGAHGVRRRCH